MAELGSVPYRRSIALDWTAIGNTDITISTFGDCAAILLKAGRFADLTNCFAEGLQLPASEPNRMHIQAAVTRLWLGPREWLLLAPATELAVITGKLEAALAAQTAAVTDVSDRVLILTVTGPGAPLLLAKGTSLDPALLGPGACCRTRFASLSATLFRPRADGSFCVVTDRTTAPYLHAWLMRAAGETRGR